ncbi:MAG: hypothetical protein ACRCUS_08980 [Anaerovoracaceae bacterium]
MNSENFKVNVLGTEYTIRKTTEKQDISLIDKMGNCDPSTKRIAVDVEFNENDPNSHENMAETQRIVLRHEIVHAFFYESGLSEYHLDEELVDWIAIQFPKMLKAFKDCNCL